MTLPFPLPDVVLNVNQDASFDTFHDVFEVTEMLLPELAAAPMFIVVDEIESVGGTPACVTVQT